MAIEVHFFDRSKEQRVVRVMDLEWHGPFWWKDGNAGCDCNRSLFMYDHNPTKEYGCSAGFDNIIVVEKILVEGEEVFSDEGVVDGRYQPVSETDRVDATLVLIYGLLQNLRYAPQEADSDLTSILKHCRTLRDNLAILDDPGMLLEAFDGAIEMAESIERNDARNLPRPSRACERLESFVDRYYEAFRSRTKK